ncbi:hypothetical protein BJ741DRAFT_640968 [Chytriomyces cf. hyalinus JEL632]|nr:hypothetical protein BJ741DRAFT_640968 [Chytriomyces cf. hyalinus JEL632]
MTTPRSPVPQQQPPEMETMTYLRWPVCRNTPNEHAPAHNLLTAPTRCPSRLDIPTWAVAQSNVAPGTNHQTILDAIQNVIEIANLLSNTPLNSPAATAAVPAPTTTAPPAMAPYVPIPPTLPAATPLPPTVPASHSEMMAMLTVMQQMMTMQMSAPTAVVPAPPTTRAQTHPQGNSVAALFPAVPISAVHKILLRTFTLSDLHHLGKAPGDAIENPNYTLAADGTWMPVDSKKSAGDHIASFSMLIKCLSTWWAIRGLGFEIDNGRQLDSFLASGWAVFISSLCNWIGSGGPNDYQFSAVRSYALTLVQMALDDPTFDFGLPQQNLVLSQLPPAATTTPAGSSITTSPAATPLVPSPTSATHAREATHG